VNDGQESLGNLHVAPFHDGGMAIAAFSQFCVTAPVVGDEGGAGLDDALDEAAQRFGTSIWRHREPNTSGVPSGPPFVEAAIVLALFNLDRAGNEHHVVNASPLAASTTADVGLIGFDVLSGVATNPILIRADHASAQFVKNLESRLVTRQSELPLELDSRHAGRLAGNQVRRPELNRERRVGAFHDRASREVAIVLAVATSQNGWAIGETIGIARRSATRTGEPVAPSCALKVSRACRLVREETLELRQRARKRQIASLKHVDNHGRPTSAQMLNILPVVGLGDNRISTERSMPSASRNFSPR
jgi:hypothetical protein